jgi:hypothetical protein
MNENNLTSYNIYSLGDTLYTKLNELNIKQNCSLTFYVTEDELKKIDEDLHYRVGGGEGDFVPSDNVIEITYGNIKIKITSETI